MNSNDLRSVSSCPDLVRHVRLIEEVAEWVHAWLTHEIMALRIN